VLVAWDGYPPDLVMRLPASQAGATCQFRLAIESGPAHTWSSRVRDLPLIEEAEVEGARYQARRQSLIGPYPPGYHRLTVESGSRVHECLLLSAPMRAPLPSGARGQKTWGVFVPLYALHSKRSWGASDLGDLAELVDWVHGLGGGVVATLPILAAFLDEPCEPSPYSPASRLFWNEFYLNIDAIPELQRDQKAREAMGSSGFQAEVAALRASPLVDHRRQMALKRTVLEECARALFAGPSPRRDAFEAHVKDRTTLQDYAAFRAVGDRRRHPWQSWPAPQRDGVLAEGDFERDVQRYHLYVQWLADEQLRELAAQAQATGEGMYLDLPLGVNSSSYDVWRQRELFVPSVAAGAPPDPFFSKGQNWGFPPPHPEQSRLQGYRYVSAYLRHILQLANVLRIDHMMGLHRLFWVPHGADARDGIYVTYPADELYAVYVLEAHRKGAMLVGEDLGTVPPEVRPKMASHNFQRMYVLQFQGRPDPDNGLDPVFEGAIASINTHDTPTFASFTKGRDIDDWVELGNIKAEAAPAEHEQRRKLWEGVAQFLRKKGLLEETDDLAALHRACLAYLGSGPSRFTLVTLEDLWLEERPQNVPGTWQERPNWKRRAHYALEEIKQMPAVLETLRELNRVVKQK
jgi:4-alpha-glucanotransferase